MGPMVVMGMMAVTTALTAASAIAKGNTEAAVADNNAAIGRVNAGTALNLGEADAARIQDQTRRRLAMGENAWAANGVQTGVGSALDVMGDMAAQGSLDAQIARWKGKTASNSALAQSNQASAMAPTLQTAGYMGAATSILGGATSIANSKAFAAGMVS